MAGDWRFSPRRARSGSAELRAEQGLLRPSGADLLSGSPLGVAHPTDALLREALRKRDATAAEAEDLRLQLSRAQDELVRLTHEWRSDVSRMQAELTRGALLREEEQHVARDRSNEARAALEQAAKETREATRVRLELMAAEERLQRMAAELQSLQQHREGSVQRGGGEEPTAPRKPRRSLAQMIAKKLLPTIRVSLSFRPEADALSAVTDFEVGGFNSALTGCWVRKKGGVLEELCGNLRVANPEALATAALRMRGERNVCQLLVMTLYTMAGPDIDSLMGYTDAPNFDDVPRREWDDYCSRVSPSRNQSMFSEMNRNLREAAENPTDPEVWARVSKWVKCTVLLQALCRGDPPADPPWELYRGLAGLPDPVVSAHKALKEGDVVRWASPTSCATDASVARAYVAGGAANAQEKPGGTVLFAIKGVLQGIPLQAVSKYPKEAEVLLPPCTSFTVSRKSLGGDALVSLELAATADKGSPQETRIIAESLEDSEVASRRLLGIEDEVEEDAEAEIARLRGKLQEMERRATEAEECVEQLRIGVLDAEDRAASAEDRAVIAEEQAVSAEVNARRAVERATAETTTAAAGSAERTTSTTTLVTSLMGEERATSLDAPVAADVSGAVPHATVLELREVTWGRAEVRFSPTATQLVAFETSTVCPVTPARARLLSPAPREASLSPEPSQSPDAIVAALRQYTEDAMRKAEDVARATSEQSNAEQRREESERRVAELEARIERQEAEMRAREERHEEEIQTRAQREEVELEKARKLLEEVERCQKVGDSLRSAREDAERLVSLEMHEHANRTVIAREESEEWASLLEMNRDEWRKEAGRERGQRRSADATDAACREWAKEAESLARTLEEREAIWAKSHTETAQQLESCGSELQERARHEQQLREELARLREDAKVQREHVEQLCDALARRGERTRTLESRPAPTTLIGREYTWLVAFHTSTSQPRLEAAEDAVLLCTSGVNAEREDLDRSAEELKGLRQQLQEALAELVEAQAGRDAAVVDRDAALTEVERLEQGSLPRALSVAADLPERPLLEAKEDACLVAAFDVMPSLPDELLIRLRADAERAGREAETVELDRVRDRLQEALEERDKARAESESARRAVEDMVVKTSELQELAAKAIEGAREAKSAARLASQERTALREYVALLSQDNPPVEQWKDNAQEREQAWQEREQIEEELARARALLRETETGMLSLREEVASMKGREPRIQELVDELAEMRERAIRAESLRAEESAKVPELQVERSPRRPRMTTTRSGERERRLVELERRCTEAERLCSDAHARTSDAERRLAEAEAGAASLRLEKQQLEQRLRRATTELRSDRRAVVPAAAEELLRLTQERDAAVRKLKEVEQKRRRATESREWSAGDLEELEWLLRQRGNLVRDLNALLRELSGTDGSRTAALQRCRYIMNEYLSESEKLSLGLVSSPQRARVSTSTLSHSRPSVTRLRPGEGSPPSPAAQKELDFSERQFRRMIQYSPSRNRQVTPPP
eukprot:Hpha_TRINITY_DN16170_c0_g9::TRINITY_DN16170_c0_g9_i1::g.8747::m.8747